MPSEVQSRLDPVVELMKMDWTLFAKHVIHGAHRQEKEKEEEDTLMRLC